jgi:hypothetical protein
VVNNSKTSPAASGTVTLTKIPRPWSSAGPRRDEELVASQSTGDKRVGNSGPPQSS